MPAQGGPPRRLTSLGATVCVVSGWSPDGKWVLFASDAATPFATETVGYRVALDGGAPEPLNLGHMRTLAQRGDGRLAIGRNAYDPARWKRYRGGTAGDIWVDAVRQRHLRAPVHFRRQSLLADVDRRAHLVPLRSRRHRQYLFVRRPTASTCAATRTKTTTTRASRRPTASASSTPPAPRSSCYDVASSDVTHASRSTRLRRRRRPSPLRKSASRSSTSRRSPTARPSRSSRADSRSRCRSSKAR